MNRSRFKTIVLSASAVFLAGALIKFPQEAFQASIRGLNMWWEIVFPSLLPFLIVSEMLIGFGVVRFIGVLLEPFMRPLFRVPGVGGFVWAMGMASGFPVGAKLTARLRQEGQLTRTEAERLVAFTNCSNPIFIFGAVSIGFFYNTRLGIILALAHYLSNFTVGLMMRFYGKGDVLSSEKGRKKISIKAALIALHRTRIKENRPIGKMLGDAVQSSINTLLMIGGFVILFSVINKLLFHMGITAVLSGGMKQILNLFSFSDSLSVPLFAGIFEITLGSQMISQAQEASLLHQVIITSFVLAFSGFSIQAQVASILAETDIRFFPFFVARILQGLFAGLYALLLWKPLYENNCCQEKALNVLPAGWVPETDYMSSFFYILGKFGPIFTILSLCLYIAILSLRLFQASRH
ncbi:sporulation integral membrane protein YlbJ [Peribacillus deserti]|uniref:Sporulation integral membrane protein YlbJ n=1 Tax=Peribacillus deserti TaxID=673318 RepID=A0A2N5M003_9BACI|nr:sporulation integral membrane protein YlbJ [Peribacillus deserti]PLT27694.1 sporulation integral membrane protein YlbJ [Peribacillus deserti]